MKAIFTLLILLVVLFNSFLAQEIKTGMEWASTVEAKQMTSPIYNSISYKIISDNPFKKTLNGQPFSNNCLIFPSVTAVNTSPIIKISIVFNKKIDSLKMRIIDLDENTNSNSDPEEYISDVMPKPYKVKNILNQNPIFLYGNVVSPDDNNSGQIITMLLVG